MEALRQQVRNLQMDLAGTEFALRMEKDLGRQIELMLARTEIYKSICHRQGLMIQEMSQTIAFYDKEEAA